MEDSKIKKTLRSALDLRRSLNSLSIVLGDLGENLMTADQLQLAYQLFHPNLSAKLLLGRLEKMVYYIEDIYTQQAYHQVGIFREGPNGLLSTKYFLILTHYYPQCFQNKRYSLYC